MTEDLLHVTALSSRVRLLSRKLLVGGPLLSVVNGEWSLSFGCGESQVFEPFLKFSHLWQWRIVAQHRGCNYPMEIGVYSLTRNSFRCSFLRTYKLFLPKNFRGYIALQPLFLKYLPSDKAQDARLYIGFAPNSGRSVSCSARARWRHGAHCICRPRS